MKIALGIVAVGTLTVSGGWLLLNTPEIPIGFGLVGIALITFGWLLLTQKGVK